MTSGYYAKGIEAIDKVTYVVTVNRGSLTQRRDYEVIRARLEGRLHCNQFLKSHKLGRKQGSVMFSLAEARHFGVRAFFQMLGMIIKAHQNPFIGWRNWRGTVQRNNQHDAAHSKYIVK